MIGEKLTEKMTFTQRPEGGEARAQGTCRKDALDRGHASAKALGQRVQEQTGSRTGWNGPARGAPVGREVRGGGGEHPDMQGLGPRERLQFFLSETGSPCCVLRSVTSSNLQFKLSSSCRLGTRSEQRGQTRLLQ